MEIPWNEILKIVFAFAAGALLGVEREYSGKPAGMRTIILITVGSALFSLLNLIIDTQSPDRIASNVVTGVGFVGAGVIFKEGMNVHGLTSAATIWVAAAIGMAIGFGNYWIGFVTLFLTLIVLTILTRVEKILDSKKEVKNFKFSFLKNDLSLQQIGTDFTNRKIAFKRKSLIKDKDVLTAEYKLRLSKEQCEVFFKYILDNNQLKYFEEIR